MKQLLNLDIPPFRPHDIHGQVLSWYDQNHRHLPWRANPGNTPNPYHVLLSEIMLQQTTVATVQDYFLRFIAKWPRVEDLAKATLDEVYHLWQGLGYYSRAKNLHNCAREIVSTHDGRIPADESILRKLPGIGPYTASAIAAIAYDKPTLPVDGNIARVFSRLLAIETPLPQLKEDMWKIVPQYTPQSRSGDFAQALMDIGATICKPKNPSCTICPMESLCTARSRGVESSLPRTLEKPEKPKRFGLVYWTEDKEGRILIQRRPAKGLLANMMGFPGSEWTAQAPDINPKSPDYLGKINHTFTHFHLTLHIIKGSSPDEHQAEWAHPRDFHKYPFPTLMKKVIRICWK